MAMTQVLVVDDVAVFRYMTRQLLGREEDLEVVAEAASSKQGVELYQWCKPDIVLLDLHLPDVDGIETLRRLRQLDPQARVVMVTAAPDAEHEQAAYGAGAMAFLSKPVNAARLIAEIRRVLETPIQEPVTAVRPDALTAEPGVLVVDDDPIVRKVLEKLIGEAGGRLAAGAGTAPGAWKLFQKHDPDLVLLDLTLGAGYGLDLLRDIRKVNQAVPVVVITSDNRASTARQALSLGASGYLLKPVSREVTIDMLRKQFLKVRRQMAVSA
ncbi:MAG: response regulator [Fimbriimonadaceae bacterium]|nr:response regulator [Fimbriimonadaceae bacterium]